LATSYFLFVAIAGWGVTVAACRSESSFGESPSANIACQVGIEGIQLKFCDFAEMEVADFHRGHNHLEGFFSGRAHGRPQHFDVRQHLDDALIEPEIA
jgi:hypothetical protein